MLNRKQALSLLAAASTAGLAPLPVSAQSMTKIRLGALPFEAYAQPMYAADTGIFARAGLDVEITFFSNNAVATNALIGGSLDVTANDPISIALAINHGFPIVILAGGALYSSAAPAMLLCVSKDSPIQKAQDFEGKTLGLLTLSGLSYTVTRAWLAQNGADLEKVYFVELASPAMPPAIQRGTIAGAVIVEPVLSMSRSDLRVLAKPYDVVAKEFQISTWISTRDWVTKNPGPAKQFVNAIYASARWANAHQTESLPIVAKYAKIEIDMLRKMARDTYATSMKPAQFESVLDLAVKYKGLDHGIDLSKAIVTPS